MTLKFFAGKKISIKRVFEKKIAEAIADSYNNIKRSLKKLVAQGAELRYPLMYETLQFCSLSQVQMGASYIGRGCNTSNGLQESVRVPRSSIKGAKKVQPSWLSRWIASWVFYVDNLQQLMDGKAERTLGRN